MSLLLNKRKRDESINDSNSLRNEDTSKIHQENNNINIPEDLLIEENNIDNAQKNNKLDAFQMMFQSMIFSPLCSNLFFGSFQKLKNFDKIVSSNVKSGIVLSKSNSSFLKNKKNNKLFFTPSALEMENNFNFETLFNNNNNNNEKMQLNLDFDFFNLSEKKNIYDLNNDIKLNEEMNNNNINNNINDIFNIKPTNNFFENDKNINNNESFHSNENSNEKNTENERNIQTHKEEKNNIEIQIGSSLFSSSKLNENNNNNSSKGEKYKNIRNNKYSYQNILRPKNIDTFFSFKRPFRTFHTKLINKSNHQILIKRKSNKPKINKSSNSSKKKVQ